MPQTRGSKATKSPTFITVSISKGLFDTNTIGSCWSDHEKFGQQKKNTAVQTGSSTREHQVADPIGRQVALDTNKHEVVSRMSQNNWKKAIASYVLCMSCVNFVSAACSEGSISHFSTRRPNMYESAEKGTFVDCKHISPTISSPRLSRTRRRLESSNRPRQVPLVGT